MENKPIKLTMDNGGCNDFNKISIIMSKEQIEFHAKSYFGWRIPTKRYKSIMDRVRGLGSSDYDKFILYLSKQ